MQNVKQFIIAGIFIGIFGCLYYFSQHTPHLTDFSIFNTEIKKEEQSIKDIDTQIKNLKIEDKSLEDEINYWR